MLLELEGDPFDGRDKQEEFLLEVEHVKALQAS